MEAAILSPAMDALLVGVNIVGSLAPVPGPAMVGIVLQAVKDAVEKAKWRREHCLRLSQSCAALSDSFYEDMKRIDKSGLIPAVNEVLSVLEDVHTKIVEFSTWGRLKAMWRDDEIRKTLEKCEENVQHTIQKYQLTVDNKIIDVIQQLTAKLKSNGEKIANLQQVSKMVCLDREALQSMPKEELVELINGSADVLHKMQDNMRKDDVDLEIEGVHVDRTQFNAIYKQIVDCLNIVERETGVHLEVRDLGKDVWKEPESRAVEGGHLTELFQGYYLQDKVVMIKCLRGLTNSQERTKIAILNQCKVWSHFKHPRVHTFMGVTDNYHCLALVSDYYENRNIMRYMHYNRRVNKYRLLAGAVEGLLYLYEQHAVCHGNLKGNNILINDEGEPLVADFQMAQLLTGLAKDLQLETATLTRQPSPRWKAPELMDNNVQPTHQSDVWSVGMLMLEVLTGDPPFHKWERNEQVMFQVTTHGRRPTRPANHPQIPDQAWTLMESCWQTKPADRANMRDVHAQLLELAAWWDQEQPAPPPEPPTFGRRRRFVET